MSYRALRGGAGGIAIVVAIVLIVALIAHGRKQDGQAGAPGSPTTARVVRVVDGDTIVASIGGSDEYVRYIGVDTPETVKPGTPVQCYGERASRFNRHLVEGRTVRLVFDRERQDAYGRLLAYVHVGGRFVNADLVRRGLARPFRYPPNTAHASLFARLADRAGRRGRGLWRRC